MQFITNLILAFKVMIKIEGTASAEGVNEAAKIVAGGLRVFFISLGTAVILLGLAVFIFAFKC